MQSRFFANPKRTQISGDVREPCGTVTDTTKRCAMAKRHDRPRVVRERPALSFALNQLYDADGRNPCVSAGWGEHVHAARTAHAATYRTAMACHVPPTGMCVGTWHAIAFADMREVLFVVASSGAVVCMPLRTHYERARSMTIAAGQEAGSSLRQEVYCTHRCGFCRGKEAVVHLLNKNEQRTRRLAWRP